MLYAALVLFSVGTCLCAVDFNERPRNFSIELLYHLQTETNGHVVLSPFGIWTLMTGVALGATDNSYNQLARALILPKNANTLIQGYKDLTNQVLSPPSSSGVSLTSNNFVFLHNDFTVYPQFRTTLQNEFDFDAPIKTLDFDDPTSARIANTYIEKSGGRVSNVLRSDDFRESRMIFTNVRSDDLRESRMIFTNVISFKGLWSSPFNVSDTALEPFYNEQKDVIGTVKMMFQKGQFPFSNIKELMSYVVELPYGTNQKYSMIVVLPYPNQKISDMYRTFATYTLKDVLDKLKRDEVQYGLDDIDVKIPRFHISTNLVLNKPLNKMGVFDIFQPYLASFKRVSKDNIFVSAIVHKVDLEVTESETVAPAATSATFADRISASSFHCNRPFVYFIMEKTTATVIFSGIYIRPTVY